MQMLMSMPPVSRPAPAVQVEAELKDKSGADAEAAYEAAKQAAAEAATAEAEAALAAQREQYEAEVAAAEVSSQCWSAPKRVAQLEHARQQTVTTALLPGPCAGGWRGPATGASTGC